MRFRFKWIFKFLQSFMATGQSSEGMVNLSEDNEDLKVSLYLSHLSKLL